MGTTAGFDCDALLFDLDGVLVDSAECVAPTWRRWAEANGLDPAAVIGAAHGRRTIETVQSVAPHLLHQAHVVDGQVGVHVRHRAAQRGDQG